MPAVAAIPAAIGFAGKALGWGGAAATALGTTSMITGINPWKDMDLMEGIRDWSQTHNYKYDPDTHEAILTHRKTGDVTREAIDAENAGFLFRGGLKEADSRWEKRKKKGEIDETVSKLEKERDLRYAREKELKELGEEGLTNRTTIQVKGQTQAEQIRAGSQNYRADLLAETTRQTSRDNLDIARGNQNIQRSGQELAHQQAMATLDYNREVMDKQLARGAAADKNNYNLGLYGMRLEQERLRQQMAQQRIGGVAQAIAGLATLFA